MNRDEVAYQYQQGDNIYLYRKGNVPKLNQVVKQKAWRQLLTGSFIALGPLMLVIFIRQVAPGLFDVNGVATFVQLVGGVVSICGVLWLSGLLIFLRYLGCPESCYAVICHQYGVEPEPPLTLNQ